VEYWKKKRYNYHNGQKPLLQTLAVKASSEDTLNMYGQKIEKPIVRKDILLKDYTNADKFNQMIRIRHHFEQLRLLTDLGMSTLFCQSLFLTVLVKKREVLKKHYYSCLLEVLDGIIKKKEKATQSSTVIRDNLTSPIHFAQAPPVTPIQSLVSSPPTPLDNPSLTPLQLLSHVNSNGRSSTSDSPSQSGSIDEPTLNVPENMSVHQQCSESKKESRNDFLEVALSFISSPEVKQGILGSIPPVNLEEDKENRRLNLHPTATKKTPRFPPNTEIQQKSIKKKEKIVDSTRGKKPPPTQKRKKKSTKKRSIQPNKSRQTTLFEFFKKQ